MILDDLLSLAHITCVLRQLLGHSHRDPIIHRSSNHRNRKRWLRDRSDRPTLPFLPDGKTGQVDCLVQTPCIMAKAYPRASEASDLLLKLVNWSVVAAYLCSADQGQQLSPKGEWRVSCAIEWGRMLLRVEVSNLLQPEGEGRSTVLQRLEQLLPTKQGTSLRFNFEHSCSNRLRIPWTLLGIPRRATGN